MQLFQKQKSIFPIFFLDFENLDSILNIFRKKMTLMADMFLNWRTRKTCLGKRLKSPIEEEPSTSNMVNRPKHYWNLNDRSVTIFIYYCEGNSVGKTLSWWYGKY